MKNLFKSALATGTAVLATVGVAFAANGYTLFGDASYVSPGNASTRAVQLVSDADPGYGGVDYEIPAGTTFADLDELSTDLFVEGDDACLGGSPRFQVNVLQGGVEKNIFVYLGTEPNFTCPTGVWFNSGDELSSGQTVDTSQLGGTFYHDYDDAVADFGSLEVVGVQLVVDASWAFGDSEQTVQVDNTVVDETLYDYEPNVPANKDDCKKDGWMTLEDADGNPFKNQGQCVAYFNHLD